MLPSDFRASQQPGDHPRPQLVRADWVDLSGTWGFRSDDADEGLEAGWHRTGDGFDRTIRVPFPPESAASGIGDTDYHPVVWYRRDLTRDEITASGPAGGRTFLRFAAVDSRASVWLDGDLVGTHEGGQTPFSFDITAHVQRMGDALRLVVRAEDDPHDVEQPRGKQDWLEDPHVIWYHRTTGIWQPVWLETVPATHVAGLAWTPDIQRGTVRLDVELGRRPSAPVTVDVELRFGEERLARSTAEIADPRARLELVIPELANGQAMERLLWWTDAPNLVDARVRVLDERGEPLDEVASYLGLRSAAAEGGRFLLNDRPHFVRAVLEQGYWPETHLAAPSAAALRDEVQLIKDLGFNTARLHEKAEDPRFLYWADRLGLMIWGESASAFGFSPTAAERTIREWTAIVERDRSHPSIVTWVPINESWGVQQIAHDPSQQAFARAMAALTRAFDPSRPVVSNDGWEHVDSDLLTIHDYSASGEELAASYRDAASLAATIGGFGAAELVARIRSLVDALRASPHLAGYCYTQLTDTLQEANGLTDAARVPKAPIEQLREIFSAGRIAR